MNATQTKQLSAAIRDELERPTWELFDNSKNCPDWVPSIFIRPRPSDRPTDDPRPIAEQTVAEYRFCGRDREFALDTLRRLTAERIVEIVAESDVNAELERRKKVIP